jgi:hypothetical protein
MVGNTGVLTGGSPKTLQIAEPSIIWYPGDFGGYPATVNVTLTYQ